MLKPLTFSLSLAVALGFCSVSKAGGHDENCTTCGLASPQGGPYATGQGGAAGCDSPVPPRSTASASTCRRFTATFRSSSHTCSYEWVLKKKHNFCFMHTNKLRRRLLRRRCVMRPARVALLRRARVVLLRASRARSTVLASTPSSLPSRRPRSHRFLPR